MVNDLDKSAIASLLTRYVKAFETRKAAQELNTVLYDRIAQSNMTIAALKSAFSIYELDIAKEDVWKTVTALIGGDLYNQAIRDGTNDAAKIALRLVDAALPPPPPIQPEVAASSENQVDSDLDEEDLDDPQFENVETPQSVREFTLDSLKFAGTGGAKAADIRSAYEASRNVKLHDKTIGMTLYRLSKDNLVRRDGRTWFFIPPEEGGSKNPGVGAPGDIEDLWK
ncbi:hypothetical protein BH10PSE11_BH10PSE11_36170 [soil metagenome]